MPRPRGPEMSQQQQQQQPPPSRLSPRAPPRLKTTNSDSSGVHAHHRGSPKLEDRHRHSPRSPLRESPARTQRKSGNRVGDLETKLGRAEEELRKLREQLASAEAAKRDAQQELQEAKKLVPAAPPAAGRQQAQEAHHGSSIAIQQNTHQEEREDAPPAEASPEEEGKIQADPELFPATAAAPITGNEDDAIDVEVSGGDVGEVVENEKCKAEALDTAQLEPKLAEKTEELERCAAENSTLRKKLAEAEAGEGSARAREEEAATKLGQAAEELARSKAAADQLGEQLRAAEETRATLEVEMKRLRVQTEQWRKAADAAAAALSADGGRVAGRCPSMDKRRMGVGFDGEGSPPEEGAGVGRRKGAGMRALGELWKKKAQQHK